MKDTFIAGQCLLFCTLASYPCATLAESHKITVFSGNYDRLETIAKFHLPQEERDGWKLIDSAGKPIPIQVSEQGTMCFNLKDLPRGESRVYKLVHGQAVSKSEEQAVTARREGTRVNVSGRGRAVLSYQAEKGELPRKDIPEIYRRGAYIHPLLSPSGKMLTDDYPADHPHHHGIWFSWSKAEFEGHPVNFWETAAGLGNVEFASLSDIWAGPVHGGFQAEQRFVDLTGGKPKVVLNESWRLTAYNVHPGSKPYWLFDLVSTQTCATSSALKLPKNLYGGMSIRGNGVWFDSNPPTFLTSEGRDRTNGNETRGRWCYVGGELSGEVTGVAVLCHPDNFCAPQPMRIHSGKPYFCYSPQQIGDFEIKPGHPFISRYRYVVFDGRPDPGELERLWQDYAHPPVVSVDTAR